MALGIASGKVVTDGNVAQKERHHGVERAEPDSLFGVADGFLIASGKRQAVTQVPTCGRRVRVEVDGALKAAIDSSVRHAMRAS